MSTDLIVTGLPRSGATMFGALVDTLPDSICFNGPWWQAVAAREIKNPGAFSQWVLEDFTLKREQLLKGEPLADARAENGQPLMDGMKDPQMIAHESGFPGTLSLTHPHLTQNFTLAMKHHAPYTMILPQLAALNHFQIVAVIRNPLDTIASWHTVNHSISEGRLPVTEGYWPEVERISKNEGDMLARMVGIYEAFCQRYWELRDSIAIVKYEDVAADPAIASHLTGINAMPGAATRIEQRQKIRRRDQTDALLALLRNSVFAKHFYNF